MSAIGLYVSLFALVISVFSVNRTSKNYFRVTLVIVVLGVFLVNDLLRIWQSLELPLNEKAFHYSVVGFVVLACTYLAKDSENNES